MSALLHVGALAGQYLTGLGISGSICDWQLCSTQIIGYFLRRGRETRFFAGLPVARESFVSPSRVLRARPPLYVTLARVGGHNDGEEQVI